MWILVVGSEGSLLLRRPRLPRARVVITLAPLLVLRRHHMILTGIFLFVLMSSQRPSRLICPYVITFVTRLTIYLGLVYRGLAVVTVVMLRVLWLVVCRWCGL